MNIDKSCYNSFCSRRLTERNAAILSSYNICYKKKDWKKPCYSSFCEPTATGRRSKKLTEYHRCTRSLWHGFFLTFVFMHRDYKRICKRYRLRLLRFRLSFDKPLSCNIYCPKESKCRHLQNPSKISLVLPRYNQNQKINQKTNPCKRLRGGTSVIVRERFLI